MNFISVFIYYFGVHHVQNCSDLLLKLPLLLPASLVPELCNDAAQEELDDVELHMHIVVEAVPQRLAYLHIIEFG